MSDCPRCKGMTMPNRGQGTLCTTCRSDFDRECEHDIGDMHFNGYPD